MNKQSVITQWFAVCSTLGLIHVPALAQSAEETSAASADASVSPASDTSGNTTSAISPPATTPLEPARTKEQCFERHRDMQLAQNEVNLVRALELAHSCTSLACPGLVVTDCARALNDLEQRVPSVVFDVRIDGQPNNFATIFADGKEVADWTKGGAVKFNPGEHEFRIELAPHQPVVQRMILGEGIRFRQLLAEFKSVQESDRKPPAGTPLAANAAAPLAPLTERRTPTIVYPLLGLTLLGGAGFTVFALRGKSRQKSLEEQCMPYCQSEDTKPMKTSYMIADISLGIGAASFLTAALLYATRSERPVATTVGLATLPGGAAAMAAYRF